MGDTGELVRTAYSLTVPHPPGYPLYNILYHVFIWFFPFATVFWRAALLTSLFSVLSLTFLSKVFSSKNFLVGVLFVFLLGTTKIFWRYAVLPDVFALNCFFSSWILYIYVKRRDYYFLIPFIFSIGLTNHLTLVFLLPIVLDAVIHEIKNLKMWILSLIGALCFTALYASLALMHPENIDSWGNLIDSKNILYHLLRVDYGTTKLVATGGGSISGNFKHLFSEAFLNFYSLIIFFIVLFFKREFQIKLDRKKWILFTSFISLIVIFFTMANMGIHSAFVEIFERFLIFPFVFFFFITASLFDESTVKSKKILLGLKIVLLLNIASNFLFFFRINDFSKNTVLNDYAINFLNAGMKEYSTSNTLNIQKANIILINTDTRYNAIKYVQKVVGINQNIIVLHPHFFLFNWYHHKALALGILANYNKFEKENSMSITEDLFQFNLDRYNFLTPMPFTNVDNQALMLLPFGKVVSTGKNLYLDRQSFETFPPLKSSHNQIYSDTDEFDVFREILSEYSAGYFAAGKIFLDKNDLAFAQALLEKSIDIAPWNYNSFELLCTIKKESNCTKRMLELKERYYDYFK